MSANNDVGSLEFTSSAFTRRRFIMRAAGSGLALSMVNKLGAAAKDSGLEEHGGAIRGVRVGLPATVPNNYGDTWVAAWAGDDNLYAPSNDSLGFGIPAFFNRTQVKLFQSDFQKFAKQLTGDQRKQFQFDTIAFNRIEGSEPMNLRGVTINRMDDFVRQDGIQSMLEGQPEKSTVDGRTWKSSGCAFIDGALYWVVARHKYPGTSGVKGLRQSAVNASIVRSTDFGKTWTRSAQDNLERPMFPGPHFATPYFIDYRKRGVAVDGADRFVYAISNNGFWDNGDSLVLGRVRSSHISRLNGSDWEFFTGGDGSSDANWTHDAASAKPILEKPGHLGETGAVYLAARRRYMLIGWYYPAGSGYFKGASSRTVWDFYEAPKPWGPWAHIASHTWSPQGYYCPGVCPKFQSSSRIYVITAGDFNNWWDYYHLTLVPVDLS